MQECQRPGESVGTFLKTHLLHKVQELQRSLVGAAIDKDQGALGVLTSRCASLCLLHCVTYIPTCACNEACDKRCQLMHLVTHLRAQHALDKSLPKLQARSGMCTLWLCKSSPEEEGVGRK